MARTAIVPLSVGTAGQDLSLGTTAIVNGAGNGITFPASCMLYVSNPTGASINLTVKTNSNSFNSDGLVLPDKVIAIGVGGRVIFGPFLPVPYNQNDGQIWIETSATGVVAIAFYN